MQATHALALCLFAVALGTSSAAGTTSQMVTCYRQQVMHVNMSKADSMPAAVQAQAGS